VGQSKKSFEFRHPASAADNDWALPVFSRVSFFVTFFQSVPFLSPSLRFFSKETSVNVSGAAPKDFFYYLDAFFFFDPLASMAVTSFLHGVNV